MQPDMASYTLFLLVSVLAVVIDGWFIRRSGATYLAEVYPDPKVADSANRLVTVLFHLVMLGIVALLSLMSFSGGSVLHDVVLRVGVTLLVMAAAHGLTIWLFARMRSRQRSHRIEDEITQRREAALADSTTPSSTLNPVAKGDTAV